MRARVGIIGTGFVARGLMLCLRGDDSFDVSQVLTRRPLESLADLTVGRDRITADVEKFIRASDVVVECSGDVLHGTDVIEAALDAGLPTVTMNAELQIVSGTALARRGTVVEAEGDQPGCLAALAREARAFGFEIRVYGNVKRFRKLDPTPSDMRYWAARYGISLEQVTAFTDGTKVQIEQALVANGLGATIASRNLTGVACDSVEAGAAHLAALADSVSAPISDYVLSPRAPAGVFVVGRHQEAQRPYLDYLKLGPGPDYLLLRPFHLAHLEIPKTIRHVLAGRGEWCFNNGARPTIQVLAVAKRDLPPGEPVPRGIGSFAVRGEAARITDYPTAVPIGLLQEARLVRAVAAGEVVTFADVELPRSRALALWQATLRDLMGPSADGSSTPSLGSVQARGTTMGRSTRPPPGSPPPP